MTVLPSFVIHKGKYSWPPVFYPEVMSNGRVTWALFNEKIPLLFIILVN